MQERVRLDHERIEKIGYLIKSLRIPPAEETESLGTRLDWDELGNLLFLVVAICHQTSPRNGVVLRGTVNGERLFGWNYLLQKWLSFAEGHRATLTPYWMSGCTANAVRDVLSDSQEGSTVTGPEMRAALIRDLGDVMLRDRTEFVAEYYHRTSGMLLEKTVSPERLLSAIEESNRDGFLLRELSRFEAYGRDPLRKKLFLFLILMRRLAGWRYHDPEHLGPPIDYHEVRGGLRTGCIVIADPLLLQKVQSDMPLTAEEDVLLRRAQFQAVMRLSRISGKTSDEVHRLHWNIFRNCCRRDEVHCSACGNHPHCNLFPLYPQCVFAPHCRSSAASLTDMLKDPIIDTVFY